VTPGSLVLLDAVHLPAGCSVWPAFYLLGDSWPNNGEIDIIENVNLATAAQYSLHTLNGCKHPTDTAGETGTIVSTDCFNATNGNQGCIVKESQQNSFGAGFNGNGGGAFATLFDSTAIKVWFFPRASIPSDFSGNSPNPDNWGTPSAYWPASACDVSKFIGAQHIIIDIDICGAFAGAPTVFQATCGTGQCVDLLKDPANYNDAYFEIKSLRVFTEGGSNSTQTVSGITSKTVSGSGTSSPKPSGSAPSSATRNAAWGMVGAMALATTSLALFATHLVAAL